MAIQKSLLDKARDAKAWIELPSRAKVAQWADLKNGLSHDPGLEECIQATLDWLCRAQDESSTSDGGVARHFSVIDGWGPSYPETTGYIIPTILNCSNDLNGIDGESRARRMLDWLLAIQFDHGGFQGGTIADTPVVPVVFNTGQILLGLAAGAKAFGQPYRDAMEMAERWLISVQDPDGRWTQHESPFAKPGDKTYETHTAWGLLESARLSGNDDAASAALRNIHWALGKQLKNGWIADCCLVDPERPLTHTLGYALKGIIEGYRYTEDSNLLDAAALMADGIGKTVASNGFIPGRLSREWRGTVRWSCLTGAAQISVCFFDLYEFTGNAKLLDLARSINLYLRRTLDLSCTEPTHGGVRGSFPISGDYGKFQYLNWAAKFFVDANLRELSTK